MKDTTGFVTTGQVATEWIDGFGEGLRNGCDETVGGLIERDGI